MPLRDDILTPIEGPDPAGPSLRYDPVYDRIKDARTETSGPMVEGDPWQGEEKVADWNAVITLASDVLATRSKDLQLAAWLVEALGRKEGFGALPGGIGLLLDLQEQFWDHLHPEIDDGDLDFRAAPLHWLGGGPLNERNPAVEHWACRIPFTRNGLTYADYVGAKEAGYEDDEEDEESERRDRRNRRISLGLPTLEQWDQGIKAGSKEWYRALTTSLDAALAALARLETFTDERYSDDPPSFLKFKEALTLNRRLAGEYLKAALELDPDPIALEAPESVEDMVAGGGEAGAEAGGEGDADVPLTAEPTSRRDAAARVAAVARYLRKEDPRDPTPYLLLRGMAWGELRAGGPHVDPKVLDPPPTALRTRLRSFILDGKWAQVLETAEEVMASPYGRGWLDLQRYALDAAGNLGPEYDQVNDAIRGSLRDLLADIPDLPTMTLMDDSPTANAETRSWLRSQGFGRPRAEADAQDEDYGTPRRGERDVHALAMDRVKAGQPQKGIELLMRESAQEKSPRARFLRRMEAAEIMLDHGLAPVARPILRDMLTQVDEHRLEEWESGEMVARALGLLYRAIEILGDDEGNMQELYLRVCRLDPMQAITFGARSSGSG